MFILPHLPFLRLYICSRVLSSHYMVRHLFCRDLGRNFPKNNLTDHISKEYRQALKLGSTH